MKIDLSRIKYSEIRMHNIKNIRPPQSDTVLPIFTNIWLPKFLKQALTIHESPKHFCKQKNKAKDCHLVSLIRYC